MTNERTKYIKDGEEYFAYYYDKTRDYVYFGQHDYDNDGKFHSTYCADIEDFNKFIEEGGYIEVKEE